MAKRRQNRKYKKKRFLPLARFLFFLLVCGALAMAMTLFFKVERVEVSGSSRYDAGQVITAARVDLGDNLFLLNKYDIEDRVTTALPYIGEVRIRRRLPSTLTIEVHETQAAAAVELAGEYWLISDQGKLLERSASREGLVQIVGAMPLMPSAGSVLALAKEASITVDRLLELLRVLEEKGLADIIGTIDCSDLRILALRYGDRFWVELRYDADFPAKMDQLVEAIALLEENERGTIRMTYDKGEVHFIPDETGT